MVSTAKTKTGKVFRAPTDQARKQDRKRENKRNKKDRQQIRQTIAKCLNVDECTTKMLAIERQLLELDKPQFHFDVLRKKQKTVMDMVERRRNVLKQIKDEEELNSLQEKMNHYQADCRRLKQLSDQEKLARLADVDVIPLPDVGLLAEGDKRKQQLMGPLAVAPAPKKRVEFKLPRAARGKLKPPGPPCGVAPDLSDSDGEGDDYHMSVPADDDLAPIQMPDFDNPSQSRYPPVMPLRNAPGPPPVPMPSMFNPMGIPLPPMPEHGPVGAVISSAPVIRRDAPRPEAPTEPKAATTPVVSAEPQLRNLRKETIKLVPTVLKRAKPPGAARPKAVPRPKTQETQTAKSTDEAYNEFMKELGDIM